MSAGDVVATAANAVGAHSPVCLNCGSLIAGRYCQTCGQRHDPSVHTVSHFLREATEDLTHADSRVWRTLFALLFKPGFLSQQFFAGRRASYLPPVRLYLVVSILLFLLLALKPGPGGDLIRIDSDSGVSRNASTADCKMAYSGPWASQVQPALRASCLKVVADNGAGLKQSFRHNVPRMMFVFLPLIALFMMLLYWRPRRYYVEHLLFLIHNHAALYVIAGLAVLTDLLPWQLPGVLTFALALYILWYVFSAMRVFYAQTRLRTASKLATMSIAYLFLAAAMIAVTTLLTFFAL